MTPNVLNGFVSADGKLVLEYALALLAIGTLSMALLELLKGVFRARLFYNRWAVRQWATGGPRTLVLLLRPGGRSRQSEVLTELELLAAGGHDYTEALYDQPVEKMMGEVQAAVHVALDFPDLYTRLYAFLSDVREGYSNSGLRPQALSDSELWLHGVTLIRNRRARAAAGQESPAADPDAQAISQARSRLANLVTRRLDAFQSETQYFWERLNQWSAMLLGAAIFLIAGNQSAATPMDHVMMLLLAIPAGIVAPFAKDLVSNLASFAR
jgi:hypothetical protein